MAAAREVKQNGRDNDLLQRLGEDERVPFTTAELKKLLTDYISFTGRAEAQTHEFLDEIVAPVLQTHAGEFEHRDVTLEV